MKWIFYVIVLIYMCYRAVYGAKLKTVPTINSLSVNPIDYGDSGTYLEPGSIKIIPCKYTNKNQQVEWLDPSGKPVSQVKTNRIFTQKHLSQTPYGERVPALLLSITDAWVEDSGDYECHSDGLSETVSLCVIDPLTFVDTPLQVSVDEGRSFTLTCEARGRPEPRLVWYRNEEVISDDCNSTKYKVMTKFNSQGFQGQLTITSIEPDDAGSYTCEAIQEHKQLDDCTLSKNWNMTLNVNHAPIFEDGNVSVIFAKYNESVELNCEPKAYPLPEFRWFSEVNEETLLNYPPDKIITSDDGAKTKVIIIANAVAFGMKYVCRASNNLGEASRTFLILKIEKPQLPDEVNIYNNTDTRIDLNVTWLEEVLFPIDEIHVQYIKEGSKRRLPKENEWRKAETIEYALADPTDIEDSAVKVAVNDLEPETDYWIRLRASNELGYSAWSIPILASTSAEEEEAESSEESEEIVDAESEPETADEEEETHAVSMFYGIFFAGGILVIGFLCVLVMRLV